MIKPHFNFLAIFPVTNAPNVTFIWFCDQFRSHLIKDEADVEETQRRMVSFILLHGEMKSPTSTSLGVDIEHMIQLGVLPICGCGVSLKRGYLQS